jgi:hypothetical protein
MGKFTHAQLMGFESLVDGYEGLAASFEKGWYVGGVKKAKKATRKVVAKAKQITIQQAKNLIAKVDAPAVAVSLLDKAIKIFEKGKRWTRDTEARDKLGDELESPLDEGAYQFCSVGVVKHLGGGRGKTPLVFRALAQATGYRGIEGFNDSQTSVRPILKAFREARALIATGAVK